MAFEESKADVESRYVVMGNADKMGCDNTVTTSKYTIITFLPIAIKEQFRRYGNIYFLAMGTLMWFGSNTNMFVSAINPWTTLGPLAFVVSVSLLQEGIADFSRHRSDAQTNSFRCLVMKRVSDIKASDKVSKVNGVKIHLEEDENSTTPRSEKVCLASVRRAEIYAGDLILVRNREMVPADIVLLASSNENGSVYIETSSIDGETNLKLRSCPNISLAGYQHQRIESVDKAALRILGYSALNRPNAMSALENPSNEMALDPNKCVSIRDSMNPSFISRISSMSSSFIASSSQLIERTGDEFVAVLTSELPNASVNTFSGKLSLPPLESGSPSPDVALGAENLLLRGAVLRNTEWAIGVACFTGKDTKLVQNAVQTPSKLSQLDVLINMTIVRIFFAMILLALLLSTLNRYEHTVNFDDLWYLGFSRDAQQSWPYLKDLGNVTFETDSTTFPKQFLTFITLNNNFIPLSLYVTIEVITAFLMWVIATDKDMYHEATDLNAKARSTIVSDLGQIKYVFSDKTGTLTQNIMTFRRCSVDGAAYGSPIDKQRPSNENSVNDEKLQDEENPTNAENSSDYEELQALLSETKEESGNQGHLSFNSEMFLRVMSICHTVVVEKDYVTNNNNGAKSSIDSSSSYFSSFMNFLKGTKEEDNMDKSGTSSAPISMHSANENSAIPDPNLKNSDGAPLGYAYQAESPDEGALVSAASLEYGFQLLARESNGIRLMCSSPSLLADSKVVNNLKTGKMSPIDLAARTGLKAKLDRSPNAEQREELWSVLAVNKFDSDRKRMSILVRSPAELGSIPILLCKGADSAMLNDAVCEGANMIIGGEDATHEILNKSIGLTFAEDDVGEKTEEEIAHGKWKLNTALEIQSHLGDFASEGLRTLVLGIRILSEDETSTWLRHYESAATSIKNRDERLQDVAKEIETKIHIVGATAIEDELQDGVPETIARLADAGIKLWVLTGDKRETAIEIGYSTKVLTPNMGLIEVADSTAETVKYVIAREFMRLVKKGNLPQYQRVALQEPKVSFVHQILMVWKYLLWAIVALWKLVVLLVGFIFKALNFIVRLGYVAPVEESRKPKKQKREDSHVSRKAVRDLAESVIETHANEVMSSIRSASQTSGGEDNIYDALDEDDSTSSPRVFDRAASARAMLQMRSGSFVSKEKANIKEIDLLDRSSFVLNQSAHQMFLKSKRTIFEAIFASDKEVRHGKLRKHLNPDYDGGNENYVKASAKALVIEGAALLHLLGDPILEEMLFAVASNCESVIACRVSPKQKALVVNLVRNYVSPEPITLAIGDGANDVGMIQEAHVGVGISGLEGQQAVNSSDFAIGQFRFLQQLLLIHGRYNFMRLSKVVLFSFYKNALLVGLITFYSTRTMYSGTPVYDQWVISMLNFVAGFPIVFTGSFDRDLEKDYVYKHPEVYASGPRNEFLNLRMIYRWVSTVFIHTIVMYLLTFPILSLGGSQTPGVYGLMGNCDPDHPGEGEGADLASLGIVLFTVFVITIGYKVAYETRLIIIGEWPTCTCKDGIGEGWVNRISYTWHGTFLLSFLFWAGAIYLYSFVGTTTSDPEWIPMAKVPEHVFGVRSITWVLIVFVPIASCLIDVIMKVFANMYFPTQTQIHMEIQHMEEGKKLKSQSVTKN